MRSSAVIFMAMIVCVALRGGAQVRLEIQQGWDGKERAGRWNPVLVRAADRLPRDVMIEFNSATEGGFGTTIREHVAIGPNKGTFELYAPSHYSPSAQNVLVIRDAESGRAIAQVPSHLAGATTRPAPIGPNGMFIGISGKPTQLESVRESGVGDAGYLPPRLLPRSAIGYDGIECLFLNQSDLGDIEPSQQRAILDWVRAGGGLLLTPSDKPLATNTPLAAALPCRIGDLEMIEVPPAALQHAGLPLRFAHQAARKLMPLAGADKLEIIPGGNVFACSAQCGLGRIVVSPIDLAGLEFDPAELKTKAVAFWRPVLVSVVGVSPPEPKRQYSAPYYGYESESEDQEREGSAVGTLCDFVAGPGSPSPRHVPLVLLAIFFIVGPLDSIVLFSRGRRPWTWSTAAAWVALLAGGTAFVVLQLRPAKIECRSVRIIDQVGDATVATADLVGISCSAGSHRMSFHTPDDAGQWWQPAIPGLTAPQEIRNQPDIRFHESDAGNQLEGIPLEAGQARFLRADHIGAGPAVVQVALSIRGPQDAPLLVGTVRNVSGQSLAGLRVRTHFGVATVPLGGGTLSPGQAVNVSVPAIAEPFAPQKAEGQYQSYGYFGSRHLQKPVREEDLWVVAPDLSGRRSLRIDESISVGSDFCCVYAQVLNPTSPPILQGDRTGHERAYQWLRALEPLEP